VERSKDFFLRVKERERERAGKLEEGTPTLP
jgi:hypothetical protein